MLITCPKCSAQYQVPDEIDLPEGKKLQCSSCQFIFNYQSIKKDLKQNTSSVLVPPEDAVLTTVSLCEKEVRVERKEVPPNESSLPEVFCPVSKSSSKSIVPYLMGGICLIGIVLLSVLGWYHRDLLFMEIVLPKTEKRIYTPQLKRVKPAAKPVTNFVPPEIPTAVPETSPKKEPIILEEPVQESPVVMPEENIPSESSLIVQNSRFRLIGQAEESSVLIEGILYNNSGNLIPLPEKLFAVAYDTEGTILFEKEIYLPQGVLEPSKEQAFFGTYTPAPKGIQWIDISLTK